MMPSTMSRKSRHQPDRVSQHRMQAIDDPTAAFPIGTLSQLVDQDDESSVPADELPPGSDNFAPLPHEEGYEEPDSEESDPPSAHASPGTIQLGYLLLSLLGGGIAAALFAVLIVLLVLLL